jgi:hypothetical protein
LKTREKPTKQCFVGFVTDAACSVRDSLPLVSLVNFDWHMHAA